MVPPLVPGYPPNEFKDRKTGLVIFGIMTILMGVLCALFVPLMFWGQSLAARSGTPQNSQALVPAMVMYGVLAVALIWLGVGSTMARRWARALLLIFSWCWLLIGVFGMVMMAFFLPKMMESIQAAAPPGQPALPASANGIIMVIQMLIFSVIFVILPAVWLLFYQSKHVKATCEAHDPVERWTDRCPLPVVAVSVWLAISAPMMLMMAVAYKGVVPFFGAFVVGPMGSTLYVLLAIFWGYSAWALYKLDGRGWWIVFASVTLFAISAFLTYSHHDVAELYTLMGYPKEQIALIQRFGLFQGQAMAWMSLLGTLPFLGYLLWVRRYFQARS
jgi:hypothetical protein